MINLNEAYLIGLLYGKGTIDPIDDSNVILNFRVKFRRPTDQSLRADNIHTSILGRDYVESLKSKLSNDFSIIINLLRDTWGINSTIDLPNSYQIDDWGMKEIVVTSEKISKKNSKLCEIFNIDELDNKALLKFPFHLNIESNKSLSLSFIQGICDSCSLIPNEASSSFGGSGDTRIQLEPSQERWELPIGLCLIFQKGLEIPVNNINWGHPQIRHSWKHQNHQFRVSLKNIPPNIELYRLNYKREEYRELYIRKNVQYEEGNLCPYSKRVKEGEIIKLHKSNDSDLNSELLHENIKGISINVPGKKSIAICKLLGCKQCNGYFNVEVTDGRKMGQKLGEIITGYSFGNEPSFVIAEEEEKYFPSDNDFNDLKERLEKK